jgi:hypothetical protein
MEKQNVFSQTQSYIHKYITFEVHAQVLCRAEELEAFRILAARNIIPNTLPTLIKTA